MSGLNNDVTIDVIIERCMVAIDQKRALEAKDSRRWWQSNATGWLSAIVVIGGLIAGAANVRSVAQDARDLSTRNEAAIATMKADNGDRLARIETKIDLMMEERGR